MVVYAIIELDANISYKDALKEIFIAAKLVDCKPSNKQLAIFFYLSKDKKAKYSFDSETGWQLLQQEWKGEVAKKGSEAVAEIVFPDKVRSLT